MLRKKTWLPAGALLCAMIASPARADETSPSLAIDGDCSVHLEHSTVLTNNYFFFVTKKRFSEKSSLSANLLLSSDGDRVFDLPTTLRPDGLAFRFELENLATAVDGYRGWIFKVFPRASREFSLDVLLSAPSVQGQSRAEVEIRPREDGSYEALTRIDGREFRSDDADQLKFRLDFKTGESADLTSYTLLVELRLLRPFRAPKPVVLGPRE